MFPWLAICKNLSNSINTCISSKNFKGLYIEWNTFLNWFFRNFFLANSLIFLKNKILSSIFKSWSIIRYTHYLDSTTTRIFAAAAVAGVAAAAVVVPLLLLSPPLSSSSFCLLLRFLSWSTSKQIQALYYFTHIPFTLHLKKYEQFLNVTQCHY